MILYYIEKYKPFDKSGSYGIQDFSSIFVKSIKLGIQVKSLAQRG